jgi:hypothetical protein
MHFLLCFVTAMPISAKARTKGVPMLCAPMIKAKVITGAWLDYTFQLVAQTLPILPCLQQIATQPLSCTLNQITARR